MQKSAFYAALALSLSTSSAFAGDGWSGFYVGFETGVAQNIVTLGAPDLLSGRDAEVMFPSAAADPGPAPSAQETNSSTGFLAGAFAGYDHQIGDFVIGGVADMDYVGTGDVVFDGKANTNYDMNWVATARVKAGWAASDKLMVFGTGGVAFAGVKGNIGSLLGPVPIKSTETGYVIGGGAEYRFAPNWSLKGEFLYHNFGTIKSDTSTALLKPSLNSFKVGLAYRF